MSEPIIGILLAAGVSRRMGMNKLALPLGNTTIGGASLESALSSRLDHTVVVGKKECEVSWIPPAFFRKESWSYIQCEEASRGQAHSLACGLRAAEKMNARAAVILLADQPFAQAALINRAIGAYNKTEMPFVASRWNDVPRPPVLFSRRLFPVLQGLQGDRGAGSLLKHPLFAAQGIMLDYEAYRPFFDIDTLNDYQQAAGRGWDEYTNAGADGCMAAKKPGRSMVFEGRA